MLYLKLRLYYRKKKRHKSRSDKRHTGWVSEGPKPAASVSSSCGVRMYYLPSTLMCNNTHRLLQMIINKQRRKLAGTLVSTVFIGVSLHKHGLLNHWPHDLTHSPDPNFLIPWLVLLAWQAPILRHFIGITYWGPTINRKDTLLTLTIKCGPRGPWWTKKELSSYSRNPST